MKLSAILEPMIAAGVPGDVILATVKAFEEQQSDALERRRANDRERQERRRHVKSRDVTVTGSSCEGVTRGLDNLQKQKISGQEEKKDSAPRARADLDAFRVELSPILDPERIEALIAVRRKKGATMTPHAGRLLAKALRQCPDAHAAADEMVLRNWTGIKPEWLESRSSPPRQATSPPRERTTGDVLRDMAAGKYPFEDRQHEPDFPTIEASFQRRN